MQFSDYSFVLVLSQVKNTIPRNNQVVCFVAIPCSDVGNFEPRIRVVRACEPNHLGRGVDAADSEAMALKQPKNSAAAAATDIKRATSISTIANSAVNLRNAICRIFVVFLPPGSEYFCDLIFEVVSISNPFSCDIMHFWLGGLSARHSYGFPELQNTSALIILYTLSRAANLLP